jgi:hypothetical protein
MILVVGDGLGMTTLTAASEAGGEEEHLAWDQFPAVALARVR